MFIQGHTCMYLMILSLSEMGIQIFAIYVLCYIDAKIQTPDLMIFPEGPRKGVNLLALINISVIKSCSAASIFN